MPGLTKRNTIEAAIEYREIRFPLHRERARVRVKLLHEWFVEFTRERVMTTSLVITTLRAQVWRGIIATLSATEGYHYHANVRQHA